jgi:hypothetical protein
MTVPAIRRVWRLGEGESRLRKNASGTTGSAPGTETVIGPKEGYC